jgi:hypothetical protein
VEARTGVVNEGGRRPGDPSVDLLFVIRDLQHRRPREELVTLPRAVYDEAVDMVKSHKGSLMICHPDKSVESILFCMHWITPEAAAA